MDGPSGGDLERLERELEGLLRAVCRVDLGTVFLMAEQVVGLGKEAAVGRLIHRLVTDRRAVVDILPLEGPAGRRRIGFLRALTACPLPADPAPDRGGPQARDRSVTLSP